MPNRTIVRCTSISFSCLGWSPARPPRSRRARSITSTWSATWGAGTRSPRCRIFSSAIVCATPPQITVCATTAPSRSPTGVKRRTARSMRPAGWRARRDPATNAKLEVSFVNVFGKQLFWGDYWIIGLGEDYDYALVGTPSRRWGWILAREPRPSRQQIESGSKAFASRDTIQRPSC